MFKPDEVLSIFFAAMREGYAKNELHAGSIAQMSGSRAFPFELGDFTLLDCYLIAPATSYSFGQTIIWHESVPVWAMSYQGWYRADAIPFLRRALRHAYDRGDFFGGRGPRIFREGGMTYTNQIQFPNNWEHFRGREEVFALNGTLVGWHEYQGLLLMGS